MSKSYSASVNTRGTTFNGNNTMPILMSGNRSNAENRTTRLTHSKELEARRAKGLCYWCPEKYTISHNCRGKQVFLIEVEEGYMEGVVQEQKDKENSMETGEKAGETPEISLHALAGTFGCSAMRVQGEVNNRRIQLLIDSGSTHNFLDLAMATKLGGKTEQVLPLRVLVANGSEMSCNRICKDFSSCI